MTNNGPIPERLLELLAEEATQGLPAPQAAELARLLAENPSVDGDVLRVAAAAVEMGMAPPAREEMPAVLRAAVQNAGLAAVAGNGQRATSDGGTLKFPDAARRPSAGRWGWLAAAACLALAAAGWWTAMNRPPSGLPGVAKPVPMARFEAFKKEPGTVKMAWSDFAMGDQPPTIAGVQGEVVWNEEKQTGYLMFAGLPKNDPTKEQYQLWIVDKNGMAYPNGQSARISGAVFDAIGGTFVIPITPAIHVDVAGAFAVTIENPGGTWVSDMSRRVVIASKPAG